MHRAEIRDAGQSWWPRHGTSIRECDLLVPATFRTPSFTHPTQTHVHHRAQLLLAGVRHVHDPPPPSLLNPTLQWPSPTHLTHLPHRPQLLPQRCLLNPTTLTLRPTQRHNSLLHTPHTNTWT